MVISTGAGTGVECMKTYDILDAVEHRVVVPHASLSVVDLEESRIHHLAAASALHVPINGHALPSCNGGGIASCCTRHGAVDCCDAVADFGLAAQPCYELNLLRKGQVLHGTPCTAGKLFVQRLDSRKVVGDSRIFVQPRKVAAAQIYGLVVWREPRRRGERECAMGVIDVERDVGRSAELGNGVGGRWVGAGGENGR